MSDKRSGAAHLHFLHVFSPGARAERIYSVLCSHHISPAVAARQGDPWLRGAVPRPWCCFRCALQPGFGAWGCAEEQGGPTAAASLYPRVCSCPGSGQAPGAVSTLAHGHTTGLHLPSLLFLASLQVPAPLTLAWALISSGKPLPHAEPTAGPRRRLIKIDEELPLIGCGAPKTFPHCEASSEAVCLSSPRRRGAAARLQDTGGTRDTGSWPIGSPLGLG